MWMKQSTAVVISFGPFVDKTDGVTLETGLVSALDHATTGIMLSKNGGAFAVRHATVSASSYDAHGNYRVTLDTTDTGTLGVLRVQYTDSATCLPVWADFIVLPANVYDSLVSGSDLLQVDLTQMLGVGQSVTDLKDFADDGYDPSTNKVQGLVAADSVTGNVGGNVVGSIGSLAAQAQNDVAASVPTAVENAEVLLKLDLSTITGEAARSLINAIRVLRNKVTVVGSTLTVFKENDSTTAWTSSLTADAAADPIVASDPA